MADIKVISNYNLAARRNALIAEGIIRNIPDDADSAFLENAVERCHTNWELAWDEFCDWYDEVADQISELKDRLALVRAAELREKND